MAKKKIEEMTNAEFADMDEVEKANLEKEVIEEDSKPKEKENANVVEGNEQQAAEEDGKEKTKEEKPKDLPEEKPKRVLEEKEVHIQNRLLKKQLKDMQEENTKLKNPPKEEKPDLEPNREEDPEGWLAWDNRQLRKQISELSEKSKTYDTFVSDFKQKDNKARAIEELTSIESKYEKENPDYRHAASHLFQSVLIGTRYSNPFLSDQEVFEATKDKLLQFASYAAQNDMNPAEYLDNLSREKYGFDSSKIKTEESETIEKPEKKGPNLKVVADTQKRSASPLGKGRSASAQTTTESALQMTNAEWQALPDEEKLRLMNKR